MQVAYAVVRAIGSDRIGIVEELTAVIEKFGCNIKESKMAVLGGEFTIMMLVSGKSDAVNYLFDHTFSAEVFKGFQIDVVKTEWPESSRTGVPYLIETVSLDSPGIVRAVTSLLADEQINIEELETDVSSAPFTGAPMFSMTIRIILSGPKKAMYLEEALHRLGYERDLNIRFHSLALSTRE